MVEHTAALLRTVRAAELFFPCGRVTSVRQNLVTATGLSADARLGAQVELQTSDGPVSDGEVIGVDGREIQILVRSAASSVAVGDRAVLRGVADFAPADHWVGRIIDPNGHPLDGKPLLPGSATRPVTAAPPPAAARRGLGTRLRTGLAVLDTFLPLVQGQRTGLFAGSGIGKSRLLANLATQVAADVVVIALVGERGREVGEFVRETLGEAGMRKAVVVAATSDQSALTRRRCAWTAMTVAEHFRDQGQQVLLLVDSVTRVAEAHREIAATSGEPLSMRGHPPSLTPLITGLCERAGPGCPGQGDITAVFSVLVAGSDMEEPVADILRGVLDGHIILSREIAERGRFPAIDVGRSVSRALPAAATEAENACLQAARRLLGAYEASEVMIRAGLYTEGADPLLDQAVRAWPDLDGFFASAGGTDLQDSFDRLALILRRAGAMPAPVRQSPSTEA